MSKLFERRKIGPYPMNETEPPDYGRSLPMMFLHPLGNEVEYGDNVPKVAGFLKLKNCNCSN
jgi:hypothetical protein